MIRKLNRLIQDFLREKRLKFGKFIWDRKEKQNIIFSDNFIKDNNIKSILFLRYDGKIGDMVVNSLMFREIKKIYPEIKIGVVTRGAARDIIDNNPYVDEIYNYEKNRKKIKKLAEKIREDKYDLLIDFSEMLRVNQMMLINLSKARFNMGLDRKDWKLFDISVNSGEDFEWYNHITDRYKSYLSKIGIKKENIEISYDIHVEKKGNYSEILSKLEKERILILNPYGASKHKSFSLETIEKILKFLKELKINVILLYYGDKYQELEAFINNNSNLYLPKEIKSIKDSIYLIDKAEYVLSPDTSIVHIASALNKKGIFVYPPNGGKHGVDHLVWAPKTENTKIIFCKDKLSQYDEIDINTFNFEELRKEIIKMIEE